MPEIKCSQCGEHVSGEKGKIFGRGTEWIAKCTQCHTREENAIQREVDSKLKQEEQKIQADLQKYTKEMELAITKENNVLERERIKHDAEMKIKDMQARAQTETEQLKIKAKEDQDKRKEAFELKKLETERSIKEKEQQWKLQMEKEKIQVEKEKEKMRLDNERLINDKKMEAEKAMKNEELKIHKETEDQRIKSKEDTAKYIEDKRSETMVKVTEIKTSAIQNMETKRIEAATTADKDRKELLMAALAQVKDPEIMKLFLSSTKMLESSVFAPGGAGASESVSQIQSAITSEENTKGKQEDEKTKQQDNEADKSNEEAKTNNHEEKSQGREKN